MINFTIKSLSTKDFLQNHWHFSETPRVKRKVGKDDNRGQYIPNLDPAYINSVKRKVPYFIILNTKVLFIILV